MNKNDPAFHIERDHQYPKDSEAGRPKPGLTARQYAAIHLCIPDSGVDWLDAMIRRKQRDDMAAKMLEGVASNPANAYAVADEMLKAGDPDFAEVKKDSA